MITRPHLYRHSVINGGNISSPSEFAYNELSGITVDGAWGLRLMVSTYTGPLVRIRDTNDDSEQDVEFDSEGDLAAFTTVGTAKIVKVYDQSTNGNDLQPSNGGVTTFAPDLLPAGGILGTPVIDFSGGTKGLELETVLAPAFSPLAGPNPTWSFVCERTTAATGFQVMAIIPNITDGWSDPFYQMGFIESTAAASVEIRDGQNTFLTFAAGVAPGDAFIYEANENNSVNIFQNDGTTVVAEDTFWNGAKVYPNNIQLRIGMREADNATESWNGKFYELCCMSGGYLTQAQRESLLEGYLVPKWLSVI